MKPKLRSLAKQLLSIGSRAARPLALAWAQRDYFEAEPATQPPRRLAILAGHWLGDSLWAAQVVPHLQARWPGCEILAVTKPGAVPIWSGFLEADKLRPVPALISDRTREAVSLGALIEAAAALRREEIEGVIDLMGNRYSALFAFLLRPRWSIGFNVDELGWLYSTRVLAAENSRLHLAQRPFIVCHSLLGCSAPKTLQPPRPKASSGELRGRLGIAQEARLAVLAPGAGWPEKEWSPEGFKQALQALLDAGFSVLVTGSPAQAELCEGIAAGSAAVLAVEPSLDEIFALISSAELVLANDSGLAHVGAAFGCRCVVVFTGETRPEFSGPIGAKIHCIAPENGAVSTERVIAAALGE